MTGGLNSMASTARTLGRSGKKKTQSVVSCPVGAWKSGSTAFAGQEEGAMVVAPQPGPQTLFLATPADVACYGGAAGGGKTFALLLDALRFAALDPHPGFEAVIFRRTSKQIMQPGGLWDEAQRLYRLCGGVSKQTRFEFLFPHYRTRIRFGYMEHEGDRFQWQGAQLAYIGFDELTHFTEAQFRYLFSRARTLCGVRPRIRATTNPDADSWVKRFFAPWVDEHFPHPARSGELRWFVMEGDQVCWLPPGESHPDAKSATFIHASIFDNRILLDRNPDYLRNLKALPLVERRRLLYGDWSIRPSGNLFKREWFVIADRPPVAEQLNRMCRYWDLAATAESAGTDPDYTVGVKLARGHDGRFWVLDVQRDRLRPAEVERLIRVTAEVDGPRCPIFIEQEPGSAGVALIAYYKRLLAGFTVQGVKTTGPKEERAAPASAQAEAGNLVLVRAPWNEAFLNELSAFPCKGVHDDQVDALSGALQQLTLRATGGALLGAELEQMHLTGWHAVNALLSQDEEEVDA